MVLSCPKWVLDPEFEDGVGDPVKDVVGDPVEDVVDGLCEAEDCQFDTRCIYVKAKCQGATYFGKWKKL